jgi:MOSC domain-containing protein YiiM
MSVIPLDGQGRVEAVNVGQPRTLGFADGVVTTAIWKSPVSGRRHVRRLNVDGDQQADLRVHGGPDKAVYAYAAESTAWWAADLGVDDLPQGMFGENLTTSGVDVDAAVVGERWRVGSALLQVSQPRIPCYKLGIRFGDPAMPRRFAAAGRPGAYLRVLEEGEIGAGDAVVVEARPEHGVTVADVSAAYHSHDVALAARLLAVDELNESWKVWARRRVDRHGASPG